MDNKNINERIALLAKKWQEGTITPAEKREFDEWYNSIDDSFLDIETDGDLQAIKEKISASIDRELNPPEESKSLFQSSFFRIAAAVLVLLIPVWLYTDISEQSSPKEPVAKASKHDISPGGQKAILILSDGSKVILDGDTAEKPLTVEGTQINREEGLLVYASEKRKITNAAPIYHTIQVPNGGTYQLSLPDGSKVWLNAATTLRYPVDFKENVREVELSGEAYFEIAKDKKRPFVVTNEKLTVEVLGTHFNLNAYQDERQAKTTLFEGKVRLRSATDVVLEPMQQAILNSKQVFRVKPIDSKNAIAWKDGHFVFENEPITSVMKKISRWYDVEIAYSGRIPKHRYIGKISRYENVSEVLKMLSLTKTIQFKVEERRITVMF